MAKHPVPGRVKTRLAAALGADTACALYRAFVLDLAERSRRAALRRHVGVHAARRAFAELLPGARCRPQHGRDLGERLAAAIADELAETPGPVLAIGADAPHVPTGALAEAAAALAGRTDVVLDRGGRRLLPDRPAGPAPGLFAGIAWSTAGVLAATRALAEAAGLAVHLLPPGFDVDEVADLVRLRTLARAGGGAPAADHGGAGGARPPP